jgi:Effector Associated Constant Component 1
MDGMDIQLRLSGDTSDLADLKSLEDWLLDEPLLAGCAVTRPAAAPEPGQMGALSDVLVVALGSGGAGAALASSLSVWLRTRVSHVTVKLRVGDRELEVSATNMRDPEPLIRELVAPVSGSGPEPA